jgi:hypothetical protein
MRFCAVLAASELKLGRLLTVITFPPGAPMVGAEYLDVARLEILWIELQAAARTPVPAADAARASVATRVQHTWR